MVHIDKERVNLEGSYENIKNELALGIFEYTGDDFNELLEDIEVRIYELQEKNEGCLSQD